jgi:hypothetical protein
LTGIFQDQWKVLGRVGMLGVRVWKRKMIGKLQSLRSVVKAWSNWYRQIS